MNTMWIFAAVIFISLEVTLALISAECHFAVQHCGAKGEGKLPDEFPRTKSELKELCHALQNYAKCAQLEEVECDEQERENWKETYKFFEESCIPESQIYQAISNSVECVSDAYLTASQDVCLELSIMSVAIPDDVQTFLNSQKESFIDMGVPEHRVDYCLRFMHEAACIANSVGDKCGSDSKDAVMKIMLKLEYDFNTCGESFSELPTFARALALNEMENEVAEFWAKK